jgi:hypothetical protein
MRKSNYLSIWCLIGNVASSHLVNALKPLLNVISAVSFTISYYSLYVLLIFNSFGTGNSCECGPTDKKRKTKITKVVF